LCISPTGGALMCNEKKMEYNEMTNDRLQISITVSIYKKKKKR